MTVIRDFEVILVVLKMISYVVVVMRAREVEIHVG